MRRVTVSLLCAMAAFACQGRSAWAQPFGIELHNTLMPAAGGMGGVSIARPQDVTSAINANPATLTQFQGTQFLLGGAYAEPTFNLAQTSQIPIVGPDPLIEPYAAKSTAPGVPLVNIGVTQDLEELGMPVTIGMGLVTAAGGFIDFRQVPASNGTNTGQVILSVPMGVGIELTDRLAVGASLAMGIAFFDGPFVGSGGMTPDYGLRGAIGTTYEVTNFTTAGFYYQTEESFEFDNAVVINPGPGQSAFDVLMDLPHNIGFGVANDALMNGRLLLAVDTLYKLWDNAALYEAVYDNQWVVQVGAQYSLPAVKLRAGYVWAENPIDNSPGSNVGNVVVPGGLPSVRYTQGLLAFTSQHRISFGLGVPNVLPGIDLDFMAGGMFRDTEQLGNFMTTSIESYWVGMGLTWRFGRGTCERLPVPDRWCCR